VVFFFLVLMHWRLEQWLTHQEAATTPTIEHFWIQVLLGKWQPNSVPFSSRSFLSSLAIGIAVILNLGVYAAVIDLWRRVRKDQAMKVTDYNAQRDRIIIGAIYRLLRPLGDQRVAIMEIVEAGFKKGKEEMDKEFLPIPFAAQGAREVLKRLHEADLG
jgi:hypothetical protein